jgi:hypothetical protein
LRDGWDFILMLVCLFFLHYYIVSPKIDALLPNSKIVRFTNGEEDNYIKTDEQFDYGAWLRKMGKKVWSLPKMAAEKATSGMSK